VFVALGRQAVRGKNRVFERSKIWWLQMSEKADAIVAAGPLAGEGEDGSPSDGIIERSPCVAVDGGGKIRLVHLRRKPPESLWRLCSVALELNNEAAETRIKPVDGTLQVLDNGLALAPLLVSADGRIVYASSGDGRIVKYPIPEEPLTMTRQVLPPRRGGSKRQA
jgi:hypothetical protein